MTDEATPEMEKGTRVKSTGPVPDSEGSVIGYPSPVHVLVEWDNGEFRDTAFIVDSIVEA